MHPQKFGVDYPSREVILFAESEAKRAEWVRHLSSVYESAINNLIDSLKAPASDAESEGEGVLSKMFKGKKKRSTSNKVSVMLPTPSELKDQEGPSLVNQLKVMEKKEA